MSGNAAMAKNLRLSVMGPGGNPTTIILLKEHKMTPNDITVSLDFHRRFLLHGNEQRSITGQCAMNERLWNTQSYMECLHQTPPLKAPGSICAEQEVEMLNE